MRQEKLRSKFLSINHEKEKTNVKIDTSACKNKVSTNKNRMNGVMMSTNGED